MSSSKNDLTLEQLRALPDDVHGIGIYFLWRGDELLYIGASTQVSTRIGRQIQLRNQGKSCMTGKPQIPFNRYTILAFSTITEAAEVEKELIRKWMPPYNERIDDGAQVWAHHFAREAAKKP